MASTQKEDRGTRKGESVVIDNLRPGSSVAQPGIQYGSLTIKAIKYDLVDGSARIIVHAPGYTHWGGRWSGTTYEPATYYICYINDFQSQGCGYVGRVASITSFAARDFRGSRGWKRLLQIINWRGNS